MSLGSVTVTNLDLQQSPPEGIEGLYGFVGVTEGATDTLSVTAINASSDLDQLCGSGTNSFKTTLQAAINNGGQNWNAYVITASAATLNMDTLVQALPDAIANISLEGLVICEPITEKTQLESLQSMALSLLNTTQRRVHILAAPEARRVNETWSMMNDRLALLTENVLADRVCIVAPLYPEFLGALAGRLCNKAVTVADSPMRTATGGLVGHFSDKPSDTESVSLNSAHLLTLHNNRYCVPQCYEDFPGMYTSDAVMLTTDVSDYHVLEHLRVADKAARQIYQMLVAVVANRRLNRKTTPAYETKFEKPLIAMSHSVTIGGETFPGEVKKPQKGDVVIDWPTRESIVVYFKIRPYNAPKAISGNILLDLSNGDKQ